MTISDLIKLIQHNIRLVIVIPAVFIVVSLAYLFFIQTGYTATASFVTNGDLAFAKGLTSKEAASYAKPGVQISCSAQDSTREVTVSATSSDAAQCVEAANAVANSAANQYKDINPEVIASVIEATGATRNIPSPFKVVLAALALGLFVAICIIVFIDIAKEPIKSREDVEKACSLPVLGSSAEDGDRILANLQFAHGKRPSTIAVVPVSNPESAIAVSREFASALERSDARVRLVKGSPHARKFNVRVPEDAAVVVCCSPLVVGVGALYIANSSDATVLCVTEWTDSKRQLLTTVRELELAKANIAGLVLLSEDKRVAKASALSNNAQRADEPLK